MKYPVLCLALYFHTNMPRRRSPPPAITMDRETPTSFRFVPADHDGGMVSASNVARLPSPVGCARRIPEHLDLVAPFASA